MRYRMQISIFNDTFKNKLDAMETEIFYFIIVQPTLEPEIRIIWTELFERS